MKMYFFFENKKTKQKLKSKNIKCKNVYILLMKKRKKVFTVNIFENKTHRSKKVLRNKKYHTKKHSLYKKNTL